MAGWGGAGDLSRRRPPLEQAGSLSLCRALPPLAGRRGGADGRCGRGRTGLGGEREAWKTISLSLCRASVVSSPCVPGWLRRHCRGYRGWRMIWSADHNVLGSGSRASAEAILGWVGGAGDLSRHRPPLEQTRSLSLCRDLRSSKLEACPSIVHSPRLLGGGLRRWAVRTRAHGTRAEGGRIETRNPSVCRALTPTSARAGSKPVPLSCAPPPLLGGGCADGRCGRGRTGLGRRGGGSKQETRPFVVP